MVDAAQKKVRRRRRLIKFGWIVTAVLLVLVVIAWLYLFLPFWGMPFRAVGSARVPLTPSWALECWLWEDDSNTAERVLELLEGYEQHDIPVRTILIDSPWSTRYNDFIVDESRYPEPERFFTDLQDRGYRVVLWMTCMVNSRSDDTAIKDSTDWYEQARDNGYLAGEGRQMRWWKGKGGFIDYTNPAAMTWWRGLQQQVFDWGLDGWKLDGTATYFMSQLGRVPLLYQKTHRGWMTTRSYMDHYYRDEYRHGLDEDPEFITLARAIDGFWHPEGFAPLDAAPVTWVGDQDHAWSLEDEGIEEAIRDILRSAELGYCVIGSDVPGFGGGTIPANLYIRWAQFSAFCGLFLNGGHGERALWKRTEQELDIIRKFSWLHTELIPYIYTHVVRCHEGGKPLMRVARGTYQYYFGDDFLVAPMYRDSLARTVSIPGGRWRYLFDDSEVIEGPTELTREFPLTEFPVYIRDGAIVPMNVTRAYTGYGDRDSEGFLTVTIYPYGTSQFTMHHPDGTGQTSIVVNKGDPLTIQLTGTPKPHILRVFLEEKPSSVTLDGRPLTEGTDWRYDPADNRLWIRTTDYTEGRYEIGSGASSRTIEDEPQTN